MDASQAGFVYGEKYVLNSRHMKQFTCHWLPVQQEIKALVFMCHGYGMECSNYTQETGVRLARAGYAVFGIDYEGHGKSDGIRCYIPSFDQLVIDCETFFKSVVQLREYSDKPRFLYGESMGGAAVILLSNRDGSLWNGLILVAPMCKVAEKLRPGPFLNSILTRMVPFIPTWKIVPTKCVIDQAFKDPVKREKIRSNPMAYQDLPRLQTALEMMHCTTYLENNLDQVTIPFVCLHGEADTVTDPEASKDLYNKSRSFDKTLKLYPGMWHGLTTGEPDHNVDIVFRDIIEWLDTKVDTLNAELDSSPQLQSSSISPFSCEDELKRQHLLYDPELPVTRELLAR